MVKAQAWQVAQVQQFLLDQFRQPAYRLDNAIAIRDWLNEISVIMKADTEAFGLQEKVNKINKKELADYNKELELLPEEDKPTEQEAQQQYNERITPKIQPIYDEYNKREVEVPLLDLVFVKEWALQTVMSFLEYNFIEIEAIDE